jgi:hypothetical protein
MPRARPVGAQTTRLACFPGATAAAGGPCQDDEIQPQTNLSGWDPWVHGTNPEQAKQVLPRRFLSFLSGANLTYQTILYVVHRMHSIARPWQRLRLLQICAYRPQDRELFAAFCLSDKCS